MAKVSIARRSAPQFAGDQRFQEARRKRIVQILAAEAARMERQARKARRVIAEATSVDALAKKGGDLLLEAMKSVARDGVYDAEFYAQEAVANLLGVETAWRAVRSDPERRWSVFVDALFAQHAAQGEEVRQPQEQPQHARQITSADAISEALRIVQSQRSIVESQACSVEIDWSVEPRSEQEAKLRAAIIQVIETENARVSPYSVLFTLYDLCDDGAVGSDLSDAIRRWDRRCHEYSQERKADEYRKLAEKAKKIIEGDSQ